MLGLTDRETVIVALLLVAAVVITAYHLWSISKPTGGVLLPQRKLTKDAIVSRFEHAHECPCCLATEEFLAGPAGGMSQNIMCASCGTRLNVASLNGHLISIEFTHGPQPVVWGGGNATMFPDEDHVAVVKALLEESS